MLKQFETGIVEAASDLSDDVVCFPVSALGHIPVRTLQRAWRDARQWLFERMEPAGANNQ